MKFFRNRSLKRIGLYLLAGMVLILLMEYIVTQYKIEVLEEVEEKKDYARSGQLAGQQIALLVQAHVDGQQNLSAEIISRLAEQDYFLKTLREGGRMDNTEIFLKPLSKLPRLTFDELDEAWKKYKENVTALVLQQSKVGTDSVTTITPSEHQIALLPAQWLTVSNWYKKLEADLSDEANQKKDAVENWVLTFIFFDLILLAGLFYLFYRFVVRPIKTLENNTMTHYQDFNHPHNEIGTLTHEVNEVLEQLKDAAEFVSAIGNGKLDFDYKSLDAHYAPGKNKLADSLISMQAKLKDLNIEEQRRQWANEGLTKFVSILRTSNDNISILGDRIISALVQYTGSNQGGLYLLNDEEQNNKYLELISLFAFDIKKHEKQKIKLGEGILGQTFLEKQTTLLTEVPEEYIRITSGLGDAKPKALVMVPLKLDQEIYGIVELASFKQYQHHEIEFVEKLAETIASTLASVKAAQKNRQLIEQFQQQSETMRAQEEEMRQNMEELEATQEEMARKEKEQALQLERSKVDQENLRIKVDEIAKLKEEVQQESQKMLEISDKYKKDIIEILNEIPAKIFLKDSKGYMVLCNNVVAAEYKLPIEQIIGTHDRDFFDPEQVKLWEGQEMEIKRDGKKTFVQEQVLDGKVRYYKTSKMPFLINHLNEVGIMGFQMDVTDSVQANKSVDQSGDWALAAEIENTLKIQLEALRIAQQEFPKK